MTATWQFVQYDFQFPFVLWHVLYPDFLAPGVREYKGTVGSGVNSY